MRSEKVSQKLLEKRYADQLRELSPDSSNIILTHHAEERMWERQINYDLVLKALRGGDVIFEGTDDRGDPKLRVSVPVRSRSMAVICALVLRKGRILVITTMWEDTK